MRAFSGAQSKPGDTRGKGTSIRESRGCKLGEGMLECREIPFIVCHDSLDENSTSVTVY